MSVLGVGHAWNEVLKCIHGRQDTNKREIPSREELLKEMLKLPQKAMRLLWMEFWQALDKQNPGKARKLLADTVASAYDNKKIETWMKAQLQETPDIRPSHLAWQASQQFGIDRNMQPYLRKIAIRVKARLTKSVKKTEKEVEQ